VAQHCIVPPARRMHLTLRRKRSTLDTTRSMRHNCETHMSGRCTPVVSFSRASQHMGRHARWKQLGKPEPCEFPDPPPPPPPPPILKNCHHHRRNPPPQEPVSAQTTIAIAHASAILRRSQGQLEGNSGKDPQVFAHVDQRLPRTLSAKHARKMSPGT
jgi:hypothetical protein